MKLLNFNLLFFSLIFLTKISFALSADTINNSDGNKFRQGWWIIKNENKQLEDCDATAKVEEGRYLDNQKTGVWKSYFCSGKLKSEITYEEDRKIGYAKIYFENGKIFEEGFWRINHWEGKYKLYHENGTVYQDFNFGPDGKRDGVQKYYHPNGKLMAEGTWKDSKESGTIKEYALNGKLISERVYNDGIISTEASKYYPETADMGEEPVIIEEKTPPPPPPPIVERIGELKDGYNKTFTKEGKPLQEGEFKNKKLITGKKFVYEGDKLVKTLIYQDGALVKTITEKSK
jgi:antitoxin component YwqK of YwqJK toxin-antitoxin module